ncbi:hypothetical protein GY45DRAFT_983080 [Cubamyces sp. BRFM 1775]|nr:hypothetical protein GY45DRAFT_983080 [Cubamyces sp. BRFM 1775]
MFLMQEKERRLRIAKRSKKRSVNAHAKRTCPRNLMHLKSKRTHARIYAHIPANRLLVHHNTRLIVVIETQRRVGMRTGCSECTGARAGRHDPRDLPTRLAKLDARSAASAKLACSTILTIAMLQVCVVPVRRGSAKLLTGLAKESSVWSIEAC